MEQKLPNYIHITPAQVKIFFGTFAAMFIMVSLQYFGIHSPITLTSVPKIFSGITGKNVQTDPVGVKIEKKQGSFTLKKPVYLPQSGSASLKRNLWTSQLPEYSDSKTINMRPVIAAAMQLYAKYAPWQYWN